MEAAGIEPAYAAVRSYRRWAFEVPALDLALRQAGLSFGDVLGRTPQPFRFVVSPQTGFLHRFPGLRLKVEAVDLEPGCRSTSWTSRGSATKRWSSGHMRFIRRLYSRIRPSFETALASAGTPASVRPQMWLDSRRGLRRST